MHSWISWQPYPSHTLLSNSLSPLRVRGTRRVWRVPRENTAPTQPTPFLPSGSEVLGVCGVPSGKILPQHNQLPFSPQGPRYSACVACPQGKYCPNTTNSLSSLRVRGIRRLWRALRENTTPTQPTPFLPSGSEVLGVCGVPSGKILPQHNQLPFYPQGPRYSACVACPQGK